MGKSKSKHTKTGQKHEQDQEQGADIEHETEYNDQTKSEGKHRD